MFSTAPIIGTVRLASISGSAARHRVALPMPGVGPAELQASALVGLVPSRK